MVSSLFLKRLPLPNLITPFSPNRRRAIVAILWTFYGTFLDSAGAHYRPACAKYFIVLLCCLVAAGVGDAFLVVFFGHWYHTPGRYNPSLITNTMSQMAAKWATMGLIALYPLEHRPPELIDRHWRTLAASAVVLVNKFIVVHV